VLTGLLLSAFFMGLAGVPHCTAMCAAPCAAAFPRGLSWSAVVGRSAGYALLGGVAAQTSSALASWSVWAGRLQSVWIMALMATIMMGAWMVLRGQLPDWLATHGTALYARLRTRSSHAAFLTGMVWAALPCGLLYGAVVIAILAPDALQGALVMLVFSLPGGVMLKFLPGIWHRTMQGQTAVPSSFGAWGAQLAAKLVNPQWAIRFSGGTLMLAAGWALSHRLNEQWQAWCA
jgi:uncharacterized protein